MHGLVYSCCLKLAPFNTKLYSKHCISAENKVPSLFYLSFSLFVSECPPLWPWSHLCEGEPSEDYCGDSQEDVASVLAILLLWHEYTHTLWGAYMCMVANKNTPTWQSSFFSLSLCSFFPTFVPSLFPLPTDNTGGACSTNLSSSHWGYPHLSWRTCTST